MSSLGAYKVSSKIGEGGMATVYKGVQVSLDRPVAIKVLSHAMATDEELLERFQRESRIIARLTHPNIIHVIDRGITRDGRPYFVMEYVDGTDLAHLIRSGGLDQNRKLDVVLQVCKALAYAHKNGVIHRDIKPANILIDRDGNARVLDFGIAQFLDDTRSGGDRTETGTVMGTYAYMSPEQRASAHRVTAASDLYSLGAVMYELFSGRRPEGRLRPLSEIDPCLPPGLDEIVFKCLDPEPEQRFGSADEVRDRLLQLLRGAHLASDQRARADQGLARIEDKFALLDVIKEDRHGAVYLYEERLEHKLLVIKRKPVRYSGYTEARFLTTLRHPHVVNVLGTSRNEQVFIVVMEYLSGGSLRDRLAQPLSWPRAAEVARQIAEGLAFAHRNRIVHGNLRPSNVLFTDGGTVKVADFGLDEHYGPDDVGGNWYSVAGEPRSMRADVFALGTLLYQMVTGALPVWHGRGLDEQAAYRALSAGPRELISRMLALDPGDRPASLDPVIATLERAACSAAPVDDAPTEVWTGEPENDGAEVPEERSRGGLARPGRVLFLLALLGAAAGYYLHHTGEWEPLLAAVRQGLAAGLAAVQDLTGGY